MVYIKDLYDKNPKIVKNLVRKLFNIEEERYVVLLSDNTGVAFDLIDSEKDEFVDVKLEDFAICYGLEYLEMSDRRLQEYLKFMAKLYGNEYLQEFHDYRIEERKELISEFNAVTYSMEGKLAKAINSMKKKEDNKTL